MTSHYTEKTERAPAVRAGLEAMRRLAELMIHKTSENSEDKEALYLRQILLSLYIGRPVNLQYALSQLSWNAREDLAKVMVSIYTPVFWDSLLRDAIVTAGDTDTAWFLGGQDGLYGMPLDLRRHSNE